MEDERVGLDHPYIQTPMDCWSGDEADGDIAELLDYGSDCDPDLLGVVETASVAAATKPANESVTRVYANVDSSADACSSPCGSESKESSSASDFDVNYEQTDLILEDGMIADISPRPASAQSSTSSRSSDAGQSSASSRSSDAGAHPAQSSTSSRSSDGVAHPVACDTVLDMDLSLDDRDVGGCQLLVDCFVASPSREQQHIDNASSSGDRHVVKRESPLSPLGESPTSVATFAAAAAAAAAAGSGLDCEVMMSSPAGHRATLTSMTSLVHGTTHRHGAEHAIQSSRSSPLEHGGAGSGATQGTRSERLAGCEGEVCDSALDGDVSELVSLLDSYAAEEAQEVAGDDDAGSAAGTIVCVKTRASITVGWPHPRDCCPTHKFEYLPADKKDTQAIHKLGFAACRGNALFCSLCFCYVCDCKASECLHWQIADGAHCHAHCRFQPWCGERQRYKRFFVTGICKMYKIAELTAMAVVNLVVSKSKSDGLAAAVDLLLNTTRFKFPRLSFGEEDIGVVPWSFVPSLVVLLTRRHFCLLLCRLCGHGTEDIAAEEPGATGSHDTEYYENLATRLPPLLPATVDLDCVVVLVTQSLFYNPGLADWGGLVRWLVGLVTAEDWVCVDPSQLPHSQSGVESAQSLAMLLPDWARTLAVADVKQVNQRTPYCAGLVRVLLIALGSSLLFKNHPSTLAITIDAYLKRECYWVVWHMAAAPELTSSRPFVKWMFQKFLEQGFIFDIPLMESVVRKWFSCLPDLGLLLRIGKLLFDLEETGFGLSYYVVVSLFQVLVCRSACPRSMLDVRRMLKLIAGFNRPSPTAQAVSAQSSLGADAAFAVAVHVMVSQPRHNHVEQLMKWFIAEQCRGRPSFCNIMAAMEQAEMYVAASERGFVPDVVLYHGVSDHRALRLMVGVVLLAKVFALPDRQDSLVSCALEFKHCSWAIALLCSLPPVACLKSADQDLAQVVTYHTLPEWGVQVLGNCVIQRWLSFIDEDTAVDLVDALLKSSPPSALHGESSVAHLFPPLHFAVVLWKRFMALCEQNEWPECLLPYIQLLTKHNVSQHMKQYIPESAQIRAHVYKLFGQAAGVGAAEEIGSQQPSCSMAEVEETWLRCLEIFNELHLPDLDAVSEMLVSVQTSRCCACAVSTDFCHHCAAQEFLIDSVLRFLDKHNSTFPAERLDSIASCCQPYFVALVTQVSRHDSTLLQAPRSLVQMLLFLQQLYPAVLFEVVSTSFRQIEMLLCTCSIHLAQRVACVHLLALIGESCLPRQYLAQYFAKALSTLIDQLKSRKYGLFCELQTLPAFESLCVDWHCNQQQQQRRRQQQRNDAPACTREPMPPQPGNVKPDAGGKRSVGAATARHHGHQATSQKLFALAEGNVR